MVLRCNDGTEYGTILPMSANLDENKPRIPERELGKLESDVEYIKRDVADLKFAVIKLADATGAEFKAARAESLALREAMHAEFKAVRGEMKTDFRLVFGALIVVAIGLASLIARSFGWLK